MTEIIHIQATVEQDGEVHLANLPVKRGQRVELSIRIAPSAEPAADFRFGRDVAGSR